MASNVEGLIRDGVAALKAGRKDEAFQLLTQATEVDERNEDAWLWLSAVVDNLENQQICLENVLAINPGNERALQGLSLIQKKLKGRQQSMPDEVPPVVPSPPPAQQPSTAPFDLNASVVGQSEDATFTPEKARGYHGSGEVVEQPSADQYDNWVEGLNLGSEPFEVDSEVPLAAPDDVGQDNRVADKPHFDPFAMPASGAAFDAQSYDAFAELEQMDDDETLFDEGGFDGASPFGEFDEADGPDYKDEQGQIGYLEYLPPEIEPTHLPGQGGVYPRSLLISLGVFSVGVVAALIALILLLI